MRCNICDKLLPEPSFNSAHQDWDPCDECQNVVQDTLAGYKDRPAVGDDELGTEEDTSRSIDLDHDIIEYSLGDSYNSDDFA